MNHNDEIRAKLLGRYQGKRVHDWPVVIHQSWLDRELHEDEVIVRVQSDDARDAAELVAREVGARVSRPTEITVIGPKGGTAARRFIGWESMAMYGMMEARPTHVQLKLL